MATSGRGTGRSAGGGKPPLRHEPHNPRESYRDLLDSCAVDLAEKVDGQWDCRWLPRANEGAMMLSGIRATVDPADPAIRDCLTLTACTAAAAHLAAFTPGTEPVRAPAAGGGWVDVVRTNGPPQRLSPPVHWRQGLLAAMVVRNDDAVAILAAVTWTDMLRYVHANRVPWLETEHSALVALARRDEGATAAVTRAKDIAQADAGRHLWPAKVVAPAMAMALCALDRDQTAFDTATVHALKRHRNYFTTTGKNLFDGQLALAPLAMASLAVDLGMDLNVESDYMPRWLVENHRP
jgi:hypothetical protein